jgi:hypothetical protein
LVLEQITDHFFDFNRTIPGFLIIFWMKTRCKV